MADDQNPLQFICVKRLDINRDFHWAIDYITSDSSINRSTISSSRPIRGIGAVDPFIAIELAENYQICEDDDNI